MSEYNGWHNYETWAVNLWIGNDEGMANEWQERQAREAWDNAEAAPNFTREERAAITLADALKDHFTGDAMPDLGSSLYADLLNGALAEVDWMEIAEHYIADVDKT